MYLQIAGRITDQSCNRSHDHSSRDPRRYRQPPVEPVYQPTTTKVASGN